MASNIETMSTYLDIVDLIPQLYDEEDTNYPVITPQKMRQLIWQNDAQVRSQLKNYYGTDLTSTPRVVQPVPKRGYTGSAELLLTDGTNSITIADNTAVKTQIYTLTFSSASAFDVRSDLTGVQGSGTEGSTFTSNDGYLVVHGDMFSGTFATSDVWHIPVYNYEGMLAHLSSLKAATTILDTIYTEEVPDASATSTKYNQLYNRLIRALQQGTIFLDKDLTVRTADPIQVDYEIDLYGRDVTNYQDSEWDPRKVSN